MKFGWSNLVKSGKDGTLEDLELLDEETLLEEIEEIEASKTQKEERPALIKNLTAEELIAELSQRGWKISLEKPTEKDESDDEK